MWQEAWHNQERSAASNAWVPIVPPESPFLLVAEIEQLPPDARVTDSSPFVGFLATAQQIPHILWEIGRLRELTFRAAGEGTGKTIDLDPFDSYYLHLFLWNQETCEVVGAYRLGPTDIIRHAIGWKGLYTSTLFTYQSALREYLTPALELGRSFIRPEYQRSYAGLLSLWKGIGQFLTRHLRYKYLFGAVSISNDYSLVSRQILIRFLQQHAALPQLARCVSAQCLPSFSFLPPPLAKGEEPLEQALAKADTRIAALEGETRGVPILVKHYLRLGGKFLGFSQDPNFNNAIDGLLLLDLTETDPRILARYMGKAGVAAFHTYHQESLMMQ